MAHIVQVHGPGDVRLDPATDPAAGKGDAIVRIAACGICGTDLSFIKGGGSGRGGAFPLPLGHEAAGEIVALGEGVEGLALGQRVVINPMGTDDVIGNGGTEGAFTERLLVRNARRWQSLLPIGDDVSYEVAALAEPLAVALHGVNRAAPRPDEKVVVFGAGPIGLGAVFWLKERGIKDIVAVDLYDERLDRARALGASHVINAAREQLAPALKALHGTTDVLGKEAAGTHVYIDAAGAPGIVPDVVALARRHARLVVIAAYRQKVELDLQMMLTSEMSITTSVGYPDELRTVVESLPAIADRIAPMISHHFDFGEVIGAFGVAGRPDSAKVMIHFDGKEQTR